jgi:pullulanase
VDPFREEIVVVMNATPEDQTFTDAARREQPFHLHLVQAFSRDPVVRRSSYDFERGRFTVPAWTTAVFVANFRFRH